MVLSLALEYYAFNFVQRNINIIATRSFARQIFDYILNFVVFFVAFYLLVTLITYIYKKTLGKN